MEDKMFNPGSIWVGKPPKDGSILTPHGNIPFDNEEETKDRFQYDAQNDKLIPISKENK